MLYDSFSRNGAMLPANATRVQGTIVNPNDPTDVRPILFEAVYGGWRNDAAGSRTYGKIYGHGTIAAIVEQYNLEVVTV